MTMIHPLVRQEMHAAQNLDERAATEVAIARAIVEDALKAGLTIDVNDGERIALKAGADAKAIMNAMFTTEEDILILRKDGKNQGCIVLVYGNGPDVISDTTDNDVITKVTLRANELANEIDAQELMAEVKRGRVATAMAVAQRRGGL